MEQLFLLEVVVDSLNFQSASMVPQKKQIIIVATFGNLVTLEIRTDTLGALEHTLDNKPTDVEINFGKSYLFFAKAVDLLNALAKCPLEIVVSTKTSPIPIANATINWESDFSYMLSSCYDNVGYMTPAFQNDFYEMRHKDLIIGDINLFVRLSCFGKSISTNVQIVKPPKDGAPASTKFLFKSANAATTYECQIYGMGTSQEFIPIAAMYQSVDMPTQEVGMRKYERQRSTDTINAESRVPSAFVMDMPVRDFNPIDLKNLADLLTGHRESMFVRPDEMQFTNLTQLMQVQTEQLSDDGFTEKSEDENSGSIDLTNLTVEKIEKQLCKCKDCPAARMFKNYGIGPLATGKCLGTVFNLNDANIPTTYGISQSTGHDDRYGPFGLYSRPKRPEQPFIPRNSHASMRKSMSSDSSSKCKNCSTLKGGGNNEGMLRLRGGGIDQATTQEIVKCFEEKPLRNRAESRDYLITEDLVNCNADNEKAKSCTYFSKIMRLRGGGRSEEEVENNSPMFKCRDLMQEFDKVVSAYKKALGPCGKAICPFAQNVIIERCRQGCPGTPQTAVEAPSASDDRSGSSCPGPEDNMSACGNDTCEYRRRPDTGSVTDEFKKAQLKSACGDSTCAYVRQRLGGVDEVHDDGGIKLHDLPRNCGGPTCPYAALDPLPPIHWDCPDPLPKDGICRNLDCPVVRRQHTVACAFKAPRPPCGQSTCPYAPPPPCDFQGCPFGPLIDPCPSFCPYKRDPCPRKCPYAIEELKNPCIDPRCPYNVAVTDEAYPEAASECFHGPDSHSPDELCPNLNCPYNIGGASVDADDKAVDEDPSCDCLELDGGHGQGDTSPTERVKKPTQEQQSYTAPSTPKRGSKDMEPPMEKKEAGHKPNVSENRIQAISSGNEADTTDQQQQQQQEKPASYPPPDSHAQPSSTGVMPNTNSHHKRKRKRRAPYVYGEGDTYPGTHVGHKFCNVPTLNVPKNMGWLWNIKTQQGRLKPRRGWRPGAISKIIAERIEEHRRLLGILPPASQKPSKRRSKKKKNGTYGGYESESDEDLSPKPTLLIKKKDGCYFITMNPLKDPATLEENENPYIDCTPMQFKIATSSGVEDGKDESRSCYCGDDERTVVGANAEASDSELDIEFTPPAGIIHPERCRRKRNIVHIDTQYDINDFLPPKLQLEAKKSGNADKGDKKGKAAKKGGKGGKGGGKKKKK